MKRSHAPRLGAVLAIVTLAPFATGCGVIFGGTRQVIHTTSSPEGAHVTTLPDTADHTTPTSISLERKSDYTLTFSKPGYKSTRVAVQRSMRAGILVLDILLGLVGVIVDGATGAWYSLSPREASVVLEKDVADMPGPDRITVALSLKNDDHGPAQLDLSSDVPVNVRVLPQ